MEKFKMFKCLRCNGEGSFIRSYEGSDGLEYFDGDTTDCRACGGAGERRYQAIYLIKHQYPLDVEALVHSIKYSRDVTANYHYDAKADETTVYILCGKMELPEWKRRDYTNYIQGFLDGRSVGQDAGPVEVWDI